MDRTFLCIRVYGEGERPEPTKSVDATIEGEPIELSDDRKSGRCPSKSNRRTTLTPKRFFKPLTQTMPRIFHVLLCDKSDEFVKIGKMCADPPKNFLDMQIALPENHEHIHWFASIPKVAIMHARLLRSSAKNRLKSSALRKTRKAIFESLEHKHLMAIDSIIGVDPSRIARFALWLLVVRIGCFAV
jgi:hypothetical protein